MVRALRGVYCTPEHPLHSLGRSSSAGDMRRSPLEPDWGPVLRVADYCASSGYIADCHKSQLCRWCVERAMQRILLDGRNRRPAADVILAL